MCWASSVIILNYVDWAGIDETCFPIHLLNDFLEKGGFGRESQMQAIISDWETLNQTLILDTLEDPQKNLEFWSIISNGQCREVSIIQQSKRLDELDWKDYFAP